MAWTAQNLPSALPIFNNWRKQTFRQPYCDGESMAMLHARNDRVLPWIIMGETAEPDYVYLVNKESTNAIDITERLTILTGSEGGNDYVYCEGATDIDGDAEVTERTGWNGTTWATSPGENTWNAFLRCGKAYYFEWKFGSNRYYSEAFNIVDFPEFSIDPSNENTARVRIEAVTTCMLDDIPPLGGQKLFVNSFTSEPEYPTDEGVGEGDNGEKKLLWATMRKRYHVKFHACESVADFCAMLPLYSVVNITDQYGLQSQVAEVEANFTWDDKGCVALVDISFTRDFVAYTACC